MSSGTNPVLPQCVGRACTEDQVQEEGHICEDGVDAGDASDKALGAPYRQTLSLVIICFCIFNALSVWFVASAVISSIKADWHISNAEASFLTSAVNVGFCTGCVASAIFNLADQVSPQVLITTGSIGAATSNAALILTNGIAGAIPVRFVVGFFLSMVYPPGIKLLSTWFSADKRGGAVGIMFGFFCMGSAFPQLLRGIALTFAWQTIVICTSVIAALSGVVLFAFVRTGPFPFPQSKFDSKKCVDTVKNQPVLLAIIAYCGHMWELFCVWAWIATFLEVSWQWSARSAPIAAFFIISMGGPGSWLGGTLGDRFGRVLVAAVSLSTSGLCIVALGCLSDEGPVALRLALCLLWGVTALADSPNFSVLVTLHAEQQYVGTAIIVQLFCGYCTTVLALWAVPYLATHISWRWSMASLAIGPVVGLLALFMLNRKGLK